MYENKLRYICTCSNGSIFDLVMAVNCWDFQTTAKQIDEVIGREYKAEKVATKAAPDVMGKFNSLDPVKGSPVEEYLNSRGIYTLPRALVRYTQSTLDREYKRNFEAMISIATDDYGRPCYAHKTYLEGGKKANVEKAKKLATINQTAGTVAIRMFEAGTALGIAEGIETALSAAQLYKVPTWATMTADYIKRFKAPPGVETLYIFADNDKNLTGMAASFVCARANLLSNNDVQRAVIRWPATVGDFNDVITEGGDVMEWRGER